MGRIVDRLIEKYDDGLNVTYFFHGDNPKADILIDEIGGYIYKCFGYIYKRFASNSDEEKMYYRLDLDEYYNRRYYDRRNNKACK
jgi:hypothetical protein